MRRPQLTLAALERERQAAQDVITDLYWLFTRTARAKPPCCTPTGAAAYARRAELDAEIRRRRQR